LPEMKNEFQNNPSKFYAKTGYGSVDQYGNVTRQDADWNTIAKQPNGYVPPQRNIIVTTPTNTIIQNNPFPNLVLRPEKYPDLNTASNIPNEVLDKNRTLPSNAMIANKVYVDQNRILNPYQKNIYAQNNNEGITTKHIPAAYGTGGMITDPKIILNKGYKMDATTPYIPAQAIRDQNRKIYVNEEQSMVVNPFYVNDPAGRKSTQSAINTYYKYNPTT
jgi:hypothetical protein